MVHVMSEDLQTAAAFASSWNNLPPGSVYTREQFEDWFLPLSQKDIQGKEVLELGCGNGSLMIHLLDWHPRKLAGIDLGASVKSAAMNLSSSPYSNWEVFQDDLITFECKGFNIVYCIGVLHHLESPKKGLDSVIRNVKPGGKFHCWVYAKEGNGIIRWFVEPIRKLSCRLPWFITKYFVATPLVLPYYLYAKGLLILRKRPLLRKLPLYNYSIWIAKRGFSFFQHVAFDQLVTPKTTFIEKNTIEAWLNSYEEIDKNSVYIIMRNGNSWKFGGRLRLPC